MAALEIMAAVMQSIPESVWSVLLGSFLTLLGVFLTNRHHRTVQIAQLKHESLERDRQRKFEARAEIYLAAAAEMAKAQQVLGNLSNLDLSKENVGDLLSGFVCASNQAILIASDETSEAINEFLSVFFTAFFRLLPRVIPLQNAKAEKDAQDNLYRQHQSEANRILAIMTHTNEARNYNAVDWNALDRNLQSANARMQEAAELRSRAWDEINRLNMQFIDDLVNQAKNISHALLPALVAIRTDLEIATDIAFFQKQLEKRLATVDEVIEEFKEAMRGAAT